MLNVGKKVEAVRYSLFITEWCNKRCSYCDIPKIHQMDGNTSLIETYLPMIDEHNFQSYTLTGGEPGLSRNVDLVFDIITKPIKVNTNGRFIDNGYFYKHYNKIEELGYHISYLPELPVPKEDILRDEKVTLYVPINNKNYKLCGDLAKENPDITFNFIPHIRKRPDDDGSLSLSLYQMKELHKILCDTTNTQSSSLKLIKGLSEECIDDYRLFCQNSNSRYLFDFARGYIYRCAKSRVRNDKKIMNGENIEKVRQMKLFDKKTYLENGCEDCYYFSYFFPYALRNNIIRGSNES